MTTNRGLIDDSTILRPAMLMDKGIPLPFLSGSLRVDEGWCAVLTVGGAFKEILMPGTHFMDRYHFFRDVLVTLVDTRVQTLTVTTKDEFTIAQPVPVKVNLDLATEYRVVDARRVATEVKTPLLNLFDRVIQAVRSVIVHATYEEFRTQGEMLARSTLQRLQGQNLAATLGMEVLNVIVTSITGADPIAQQHIKEFTTVRNWQLDSTITLNTRVTPEWLLINRPEIYQQIIAGNTTVLKELIDKGLLDPAGFLNQPTGALPPNISAMLGQLAGGFQAPGLPSAGARPTGPVTTPPLGFSPQPPTQLPPATPPSPAPASDARARVKEDLEYLREFAKQLPDARASAAAVIDEATGLPDGRYVLEFHFTSGAAGQLQRRIQIKVKCPVGYPRQAPLLEVQEDGQLVDFPSVVLGKWNSGYAVEIAREVHGYYG